MSRPAATPPSAKALIAKHNTRLLQNIYVLGICPTVDTHSLTLSLSLSQTHSQHQERVSKMSFDREAELEDFDKLNGRGTTILSHIHDDTVYMVSDGRRCSSTPGALLVLQGNDQKIYRVSDKICATTAGNVALANEMLDIASREAQSSGNVYKVATKLKKYKEKCLKELNKERKKNKNKERSRSEFAAVFGLNSVDEKNGPYIQLIGMTSVDLKTNGAIQGFGTGGDTAHRHFRTLIQERVPQTPLERLFYMKQSAVVSGLDDIHSGGFIQGAILSPTGLMIEENKVHMITHLAENHQLFVGKLRTQLLCITRDFPYTIENEKVVSRVINNKFPGILKELVLGVNAPLIVRSLDFCDADTADRAYSSVEGGHFVPLTLDSGVTHRAQIRRPTRDQFIAIAGYFADENIDVY